VYDNRVLGEIFGPKGKDVTGKSKGKVHRCTGTEALYRLYGP